MQKVLKYPFSEAYHHARALSDQALVRPKEAAAMLGISRKHLYELSSRPGFPSKITISDRVVAWRVSDLKNWIQQMEASND
jgi:predicted DNA-binding transcriptional regulator AlpA